MKEEKDVLKLLRENKYFAIVHSWKQYPVFDDTDRYIEGWNTTKEDFELLTFENAREMSYLLGELSVTAGESEGTFGYEILLANPKDYGRQAEYEEEKLEEEELWKKQYELEHETLTDSEEKERLGE